MPKYIALSLTFTLWNKMKYVSISTVGLGNKAWGGRFITLLELTVAARKICSGVKCETFCLKCYSKILILAAPEQSATIFFVSFLAVNGANENCAV